MAKKIFSGKERFMVTKRRFWTLKNILATLVFLVVLFSLYYVSHSKEDYSLEIPVTEDKEVKDDLEQYRNLSAKELLDNLNEEKGFKQEHPIKVFEIAAEKYSFSPDEISAKMNDTIIIKITAVDRNYSIGIPSFFISRDLPQGEEVTIEFIASKTGQFVFRSLDKETMDGRIVIV